MKVILTGSLGHISRPLALNLLAQGYDVTVISSNPQKRAAIESLGATAATGSVEDVRFLSQTFAGADAVYCMTPPNFGEPDQVAYYERTATAYAEAIRQAGVKRVLYLSSYGAHLPSGTGFITGSHKAETVLNAVPGLTVTHIRPTFFYSNLLGFIPMIRAGGFIGAVYGGADQLAMVAPPDIAAAIADELAQPRQGINVLYVSSDDRTCKDVAAVLGNAIGQATLEWKVLPPETVLQSLLSTGMPRNAADNLVELGLAIHTGALRSDFEHQRHFQGQVALEAFAGEFAAAYNQSTPSH